MPRLTEIYNHYVINSTVTFDTTLASPDQRLEWFNQFSQDGLHRCLVATGDSGVLGAAYSSRYRAHPAFDETVETSIYMAPEACGRGLGTELYSALLDDLARENVHLAVAGVALPNDRSVALHERVGFSVVGVFSEYAVKHGQRISSIWFQKRIGTAA